MAKFNVHGGHAAAGNKYCGAASLINESVEDRKVKDAIINILKADGHTAYDCTISSGNSQTNILSKICSKCNQNKVDLDVSIHFNAGANDKGGNGSTCGVECFTYNTSGKKYAASKAICQKMSELGFKNRGAKTSTGLYFLKHTVSPAILVEVCFVDDKDDVNLYNKLGVNRVAQAIVDGMYSALGIQGSSKPATSTPAAKKPMTSDVKPATPAATTSKSYLVTITASSLRVRSGASASSKVVGSVKKGQVYTIVEEKNGWGKLKSGAGWICLGYTKKK